MIKKKLQLQQLDEYFWKDSRVVLGYIANDTKAFKTFVANSVHMTQEHSIVEQWKHVPSKENPADDASRGMNFKRFSNIDRWFQGPNFGSSIIVNRSRIEKTSENKQDFC